MHTNTRNTGKSSHINTRIQKQGNTQIQEIHEKYTQIQEIQEEVRTKIQEMQKPTIFVLL